MAIKKREFFPTYMNDIYIMLTERCPMRCEYCYIKHRADGETITKETLDKLMEKVTNKPRIIFFGGEPLLEVELMKWFIDKYKDRVSAFQTVTSMSVNFDQFYNEVYKKVPGFELQLSWDGFTTTRLLGGKKNLSDKLYGKYIEKLWENNDRFQIRTVVNDTNIDSLYELYKTYKELQQSHDNFCADMTLAHQTEYAEDFPKKLQCQLNRILANIKADINKGRLPYIQQWMLHYLSATINDSKVMACNVGTEIVVRPNGDIYPCTMLSQAGELFKLGNVNDEYLDTEIIDSLLKQPAECEDCVHKKNCMGGCRYERYMRTKNLDIVNPCYCEQGKVIIPTMLNWITNLNGQQTEVLAKLVSQYMKWRGCQESEHKELLDSFRGKEILL